MEGTCGSRMDRSAITLDADAVAAAAVCAAGASAGPGGGGQQNTRRRTCGCCLPGGLQGKDEEKEGVADTQPIVTNPSVCDNWGVDDGRLNNSGLFLFFPLYLIGP